MVYPLIQPFLEYQRNQRKLCIPQFPQIFLSSAINNFQKKPEETNDYIIPPGFFHISKKAVLVNIPYCPGNEELSKRFMEKFEALTDNKYNVRIKWITKKVK